jgi:hypothetical protein
VCPSAATLITNRTIASRLAAIWRCRFRQIRPARPAARRSHSHFPQESPTK